METATGWQAARVKWVCGMRKIIHLKYGATTIGMAVPDHADRLTISEPQAAASETGLAADIDKALCLHRLSGSRVAVVVADKTRLCGYDQYLPVLLDRIRSRGARPDDITCFIAYGTHPRQSDAESRSAYGDVYGRYRFIHHDCDCAALFQDRGSTARATPIRLRKDILAADLVITYGAISHHYFAGFGGGRKLIFPGLGQREGIHANHGLFLDPHNRVLAPVCRSGRLDGNPLAEDLAEVEQSRPADLAIHGILDSSGRVCQLLVGSGSEHFRRACACHAGNCERHTDCGYDTVLASCGGFPKDVNFIQSHKAVHHAAAFVNDGGTLVLLAQCPDGIGSTTFLPWFDQGWDAAFDQLSRNYQGNGGTALAMMAKTRRIRICMVTDLDSDLCQCIGVEKIDAVAAVDLANHPSGSLAVIPNASLLVRA